MTHSIFIHRPAIWVLVSHSISSLFGPVAQSILQAELEASLRKRGICGRCKERMPEHTEECRSCKMKTPDHHGRCRPVLWREHQLEKHVISMESVHFEKNTLNSTKRCKITVLDPTKSEKNT